MPNGKVSMEPFVPPLAVELCETFLFGASLLLDTLLVSPRQGIPRGVLSFVCLLDFSLAVSIRTSRLWCPILTRTLGAKGCPIAQQMLCWSCP